MVLAFDAKGEQMPEWQGLYEEIIPKLLRIKWGALSP